MKKIITTAFCLLCLTSASAVEDYYKNGLQCASSMQENHKQTSYIGLVLVDEKNYTGIYTESFSRPNQTTPAKKLLLDDGEQASLYIWSAKRVMGPMSKKSEFHPNDIAITLKNAPSTHDECIPWTIEPEKFVKPQKD